MVLVFVILKLDSYTKEGTKNNHIKRVISVYKESTVDVFIKRLKSRQSKSHVLNSPAIEEVQRTVIHITSVILTSSIDILAFTLVFTCDFIYKLILFLN